MSIKLAIAGAAGRMGQSLVRMGVELDGYDVVGGTEQSGSKVIGKDLGEPAGLPALGFAIANTPVTAAEAADVWVDFTTPAAVLAALDALPSTDVKAAVIGATGFTAEEDARVAEHARRIAIVKAGNFSLGVNLMLALVQQASERLGADWDIEIHEAHHRRKIDAPSGTALMIGDAAASGRGRQLKDVRSAPYDGIGEPRESGTIGFSVTRGGGIVGDHEAQFVSDQEVLSIGHRALDRSLFAKGALHAAKWVIDRPPGLYSMRDVLSL